ncbi:hypothetical protein N9V00_00585 [Bacteroidota bacterium]|nr:hypothetical protein [Bacteroidota bacterium]
MEELLKHLEVDDWREIFRAVKEHTQLFDDIQQLANAFIAEHRARLDSGKGKPRLPAEYYHAERLILILSYYNIIDKDEFS